MPTIQALAGAIGEKIDQKLTALSNNTNSGQKRRQLPVPYNPCPACGSTKQNPVGDEHHYVVDCPKWDFRLGLDINDDVYVAKCEMRLGCSKTEQPWFKVKQREGTKLYWQQPDFKPTHVGMGDSATVLGRGTLARKIRQQVLHHRGLGGYVC